MLVSSKCSRPHSHKRKGRRLFSWCVFLKVFSAYGSWEQNEQIELGQHSNILKSLLLYYSCWTPSGILWHKGCIRKMTGAIPWDIDLRTCSYSCWLNGLEWLCLEVFATCVHESCSAIVPLMFFWNFKESFVPIIHSLSVIDFLSFFGLQAPWQ